MLRGMETPPMSNYPRGGGPGGGGNYAMPTRGPGVYFDYIGIAWRMLTKNPSVYIVGGLVIFVAIMAVNIPVSIIGQALGGNGYKMDPQTGRMTGPNIGSLPITMVLNLIAGAINTALMTGIALAAIEEADTGQTKFETLFSGFKNFGQLLVGSILYSLAVTLGMVLCIVPGLYLAGALSLTTLIIILEGVAGVDALKLSYTRMKPYAFSMLGLVIVAAIVSSLGLIACCIGVVVTWPLYYIVIGLTYRDFRSLA